ncbi:MAG: NAD(P)-dependent oxidoreductase [Candidatus Micrarchaeia archaeon]|jgi:nucleoside-diphosphate-sugar epimerase
MIRDFPDETEAKLSSMAPRTRVLVTGGSGYLGSVLVEMLVGRGFDVTVVDNLAYSQNTLFNLFHNGRLRFVFGDVTSEKFMEKLLSEGKYDYIFPLAAVVGFPVSEQKPEITWLINQGSIEMLLKHRKKGARVVFPTTNSGYGITDGKSECTEDSPLNPVSTYGKSKVAAEKAVAAAGDSICFRLATLFGFSPRMRTDLLVNDFVCKAVKEKSIILFERKFKRNFLHVRDAARAFLWAMANWEKMKNKTYNLGHPDYNISKDELCQLIKKRVPALNIFYAEIGSDPDKRNYVVSNARMLSTGFSFNHTLEAGIDELARGYEAFRDYRFKNY